MENEHHGDFRFWVGFFIGGLIGAVVLFFVGTKEGKRTGKLLEKKGKEALGDLEEKVEDLQEKGKELLKEGDRLKEEVLDTMNDQKEELTGEVKKRLDKTLETLEEAQKESLSATTTLRRKHFKNLPKK